MLSVFDVANYFIWAANEARKPLSNLKLLKLLYYAQGFYLALYEKPLFSDEIIAWRLGPVIPSVYQEYRGEYDIELAEPLDWDRYDPSVVEILSHVHDTLGEFTPEQLSLKTHEESPWKSTCRNCEISRELMMNFFRDNLERFGFKCVDPLAPVRQRLQAVYEASAPHEDLGDEDDIDFQLYLELKEEWSEVYRRLADS